MGILAVVQNGKLEGLLTDRDIVARYVANIEHQGCGVVGDFMSRDVIACNLDDSIDYAAALMADHQVRRLPVLGPSGSLAGLMSLDAIAEDYSERLAGETLGEVVESR